MNELNSDYFISFRHTLFVESHWAFNALIKLIGVLLAILTIMYSAFEFVFFYLEFLVMNASLMVIMKTDRAFENLFLKLFAFLVRKVYIFSKMANLFAFEAFSN